MRAPAPYAPCAPAAQHIFEHIRASDDPGRFAVRLSYLQIYNESISDLLSPERSGLAVREDRSRGLFVEGLSEWAVHSTTEVGRLLARGQSARATGSTRTNELSSRSHAVVLVVVEQAGVGAAGCAGAAAPQSPRGAGCGRSVRVGKLNLVDLAGSERLSSSDASGTRLQESRKINTSLSALGNVVAALSDRSNGRLRAHIPYRDSKLTRILEDSLGGNCKTTLIALVSPAAHAFPESLSTLKFATRAKTVRNQPTLNVDGGVDLSDQSALLRAYEAQLAQLRSELRQRSKTLTDSARLLELEQLHRRAEEDRLEAMRALEQRTAEYLSEKAHKRMLEARIAAFQSQLLGHPLAALAEGGEYAALVASVDGAEPLPSPRAPGEAAGAEQEKVAALRYGALLAQQRERMLALSRRLSERDNSLLDLQAELEAVEARAMQLEDELDARTLQLLRLQRIALEHGVPQDKLGVSPAHTQRLLSRYGSSPGGVELAAEPEARRAPVSPPPASASEAEPRRPLASPLAGAEHVVGFAVPRPFRDDGSADQKGAHWAAAGGGPPAGAGQAAASAQLAAAAARNAELEARLAGAQEALARGEASVAARVQQLVDAEVEHVAADAVEVVAEAKAARRAAEALHAELGGVRLQLGAAEAARDAHAAQLLAASAELSSALADARTMLARAVRADGVSETARSSALTEAALSEDHGASIEERVRVLRRACAAALSVSSSAEPVAARSLLPGADGMSGRAEAAEQHVLRLKHRCAAHAKERAALTSILDKKVKVLVDELAKALAAAPPHAAPASPGAGRADSPSMKAARKQIGVLQRLVHAAVAALKMPDATTGDSGGSEGL